MLSLTTLTENSPSLAASGQKVAPRKAEDKQKATDFQSYLAPMLQPMREPTAAAAAKVEPAIHEAPKATNNAELSPLSNTQKAGHEVSKDGEISQNAGTEKAAKTTADKSPKAVTTTHSERELLEALGLISRKAEIPARRNAGFLNAAAEATYRKEAKLPVAPKIFNRESPAQTLTLLEKTPDLVLMSSEGIKKLSEKLGISLLSKVSEKLGEKNRTVENALPQPQRAENKGETVPAVIARVAKTGEREAENLSAASGKQQRSVNTRNVSRETTPTAESSTAIQAEPTSIKPTSGEVSLARQQPNAMPGELRLADATFPLRNAESVRSAVENPLMRPELVRQFNEIITRAQVLIQDNQNAQFSVRLNPREIGRMQIDLRLIDGEIRGKIVVESEEVKNEMQNFLQNRDYPGSAEQFDLNKIDIEVRSGNRNAHNPERTAEAEELLKNLVTRSASAAYSATETVTTTGNALYA